MRHASFLFIFCLGFLLTASDAHAELFGRRCGGGSCGPSRPLLGSGIRLFQPPPFLIGSCGGGLCGGPVRVGGPIFGGGCVSGRCGGPVFQGGGPILGGGCVSGRCGGPVFQGGGPILGGGCASGRCGGASIGFPQGSLSDIGGGVIDGSQFPIGGQFPIGSPFPGSQFPGGAVGDSGFTGGINPGTGVFPVDAPIGGAPVTTQTTFADGSTSGSSGAIPNSGAMPNPVTSSEVSAPSSTSRVLVRGAGGNMFVDRPNGVSNQLFIRPNGQVFERVNGRLQRADSSVLSQLTDLYGKWKAQSPTTFPPIAQAVLTAAATNPQPSSSVSDAPVADVATPTRPTQTASTADAPVESGSHGTSDTGGVPPTKEGPEKERPSAPPGSGGLVCSDPKKAICDSAKSQYSGDKSPTKRRKETFDAIVAQLGREPNREALKNEDLGEWVGFLRAAQKLMVSRGIEKLVNQEFQRVRTQIRADIAADNSIPQNLKVTQPGTPIGMLNKLDGVQIVNLAEDVMSGGKAALEKFRVNCGSDGLSAGAFYRLLENKLYLCPAFYLFPPQDSDLLYTLGHEVGHSVDSGVGGQETNPLLKHYPEAWGNFLACYNHPDFKDFKQGSSNAEKVADYISFNVFVKTLPSGDPEAALASAGRFMGHYCAGGGATNVPSTAALEDRSKNVFQPSGKALHADHDFRIGVMLGRHPAFRRAVGCPAVSRNMPACDNAGRINESSALPPSLASR